jgi:hypothetical protein
MRRAALKSRKLWLGIVCFLLHVGASALGVAVPAAATAGLLGALGAEGLADAAGALRGKDA